MLGTAKAIISAWAQKEDDALRQQFMGTTAEQRFEGLGRARRNEVLMFLAGAVPALIVGPPIGKWSDAAFEGKVALATVAAWAVFVWGTGSFFVFRSLIRLMRMKRN